MEENDKMEQLSPSSKAEMIIPEEHSPQQKKSGPRVTPAMVIAAVLLLAFLTAEIIVRVGATKNGTTYAQENYQSAYTEQHDNVYSSWYQKYYDLAEEEWHVSNRAAITLGDLRETSSLEVLSVSDTEYVIQEGDSSNGNVTAWLEVPGTGTYIVDLQAAEFIVDDENSYVLARVPKPELTNVAIDYTNVNKLLFEDNDFNGLTIANESIRVGEDDARSMLDEGDQRIERALYSNQYFYQSAVSAAEDTIIFMIKQFNPGIPELTVEVEFF